MDREQRRRQLAEYKRRSKVRARLWLKEYLRSHPCVDCGEADVRVLEFDHRDPATKLANVSRMASDGCGPARLAKEVAKCDVRCCNCHRRRTHAENHSAYRRDA
jgi:hypothetical protein